MSFSKLNYINVGKSGTYTPTGEYKTTPEDIQSIISHVSETSEHIAIHFHGGLVDEDTGMQTAKNMASVYKEAGAHPITFVWETGFLETLKESWKDISVNSGLLKKIVQIALQKVVKKVTGIDGGKSASNLDITTEQAQQILEQHPSSIITQADLEQDLSEFASELKSFQENMIEQEFENEIRQLLIQDSDLKAEFDSVQEGSTEKGLSLTIGITIARIAIRVFKRYRRKNHHGLHATIVEESLHQLGMAPVGREVWSAMKNKSNKMWTKSDSGTQYPGYDFFQALNQVAETKPNLKIDLIGHSAGAVAICNLLKAISDNNFNHLTIRNIIFLAPAVTMELFKSEMIDNSDRFDSLSIFTMRNKLELADTLVGDYAFIYPSSLLYFISGVLEEKVDTSLVGMHRFYGGTGQLRQLSEDEKETIKYIKGADVKLALSKSTGKVGLETQAIDHGAFDEDKYTRLSIQHILRS